MDDIYSDLENFNDVNIVEELKNENKELKFKLEEYSGAMHGLQKIILQEFDKLNVEHKNLEKNYSSLLKTARAEIERKTETIKTLNLEKDTLVLNSLQNGKNILQNRRSNFKDTHQNKKSTEDTNSCLKEVKKIIKESAERLDNQLHVNRQPSVDTVSSIPTDCLSAHSENVISKTDNKIPKEECIIGRERRDKACSKNNVQEQPSVRKVMNRRKSMLNFGDCDPTYSSDDDSRKSNLEQQQQRDLPLVGEDVRHFERHYEQQDYVVPESFDYYQPPQSSYRNRGNRYNDVERQRNYECYDKSRRYFSPDNHHRYGKELPENYNQRDYRDKRRAERSPPSDRYNRSKSRDKRHNLERDNHRDYGRYSYHNSDHLAAKNKSKFEFEESSSKRPKVDSYSRHSTEHNFKKENERVLSERHTFTKPQKLLEPPSCQSPDYVNVDSNLHHSVKEIKHSAWTRLPDPKPLNNKNFLKSNSEKPVLAPVVGCNADIVPISNPTSGEDKRKSLGICRPEEVDLVSEIYMGIENFGKSPSLESGEIQSLDDDHYATNYSNIADKVEDNVKSVVHSSHQIYSQISSTKEEEKEFTNKYKIPHLKGQNITKESSITQEQEDVPKKKLHAFVKDFKVIVEGKHLSEKCSETNSNNIASVNAINNKKPESVLQKLMNEIKLSESANPRKYRKSDKIVNISTIEGDLELSDETSDNVDLLREESSRNTMKDEKKDHLIKKEENTSSEKLKGRANKSNDKVKQSKDTRKSSHSKKEHVKEKTRDSSRKRKNKKQNDQEVLNVAQEELSPKTKRSKSKGNKLSSSNEKKNKFTDLFGDSNSLITPDDLGISNVTPDKYVPVFENTQDAVDLSVDITMARKSADKTSVEEKSNQQISDDSTIVNSLKLNSNENENYKSTTHSYENTISETNTSNIVKTVIISTGIQPQHISKDIEVIFPPSNINEETDFKKCALNTIKANATSTPYKVINAKESQITIDATLITNESVNTKENVDKTDLHTNNVITLKTNTSEDKYESDIPDVRIFVRRRKKATKKST